MIVARTPSLGEPIDDVEETVAGRDTSENADTFPPTLAVPDSNTAHVLETEVRAMLRGRGDTTRFVSVAAESDTDRSARSPAASASLVPTKPLDGERFAGGIRSMVD